MNKKIVQKMCIASLLIIFGCFLTSLVFSPKVSAVDSVIQVGPPEYVTDFIGGECVFYDLTTSTQLTSTIDNNKNCSLPSSVGEFDNVFIRYFKSPRSFNWEKNYVYKFSFTVRSATNLKTLPWNITPGVNARLISISNDFNMTFADFCSSHSGIMSDSTTTGAFADIRFTCLDANPLIQTGWIGRWTVEFVAVNSINGPVGWGNWNTPNAVLRIGDPGGFSMNIEDVQRYPIMYKDDIVEAEQKTEEATNEGESNAQSSESQNEGATQNVISVMGQVVSAFQTPAGDCSLDMDLGNVDFGGINLCSGKPPAIASLINLIGSIVVVYAIYLCSRAIFRIWLAMSVFAQGGSSNG